MATERIISPAVFTREFDQTYLPQGIANIGGAIVGPFSRGPAFAPTVVTTQADLETYFGLPDGKYYTPYTAQEYLKHQGTVTIVRVGGFGGYIQHNPAILIAKSGSMTSNGSGSWLPDTFVTSSGGEQVVLAVLANTAFDSGQLLQGFSSSSLIPETTASVTPNFTLLLRESGSATEYGPYYFSLNAGSSDYITNVFGTDPLAGQEPLPVSASGHVAYIYKIWNNTIDTVVAGMLNSGSYKIFVEDYDVDDPSTPSYEGWGFAMKFQDDVPGGGGGVNNVARSSYDIRQAETPWVHSQVIASQSFQLFKIHTLSDGTSANKDYKIEIDQIKMAGTVPGSEYGSFSLTVRAFTDTDRRPYVLESFQNLSLDPNSSNYIARRIGDRWVDINYNGKILEYGDFANQSKYIRVEMTVAAYPVTANPWGFDAYASPIGGFFGSVLPPMQYSKASLYSKQLGKYSSGVVFDPAPPGADAELLSLWTGGTNENISLDNKQYFAPIPESSSLGSNVPFDLTTICGLSSSLNLATENQDIKKRSFVFGFQQGFDGQSPSIPIYLGDKIISSNQQGLDCTSITSSGSVAYKQAIAAVSNADEFDINLLVTPGINYNQHSYVATLCVDVCEERGDCFHIMDLMENQTAGGNSIDNVVERAAQFDTNYAAAYYPWVKIVDQNTNRIITVPPSVVLPAVYAQNDQVSAEWFAPAGLNRGGIANAVQVVDRLTHAERDSLYEGKVNPIAAFPGQGIVVWGQKTLQNKSSALDRVNVRRLLIALKKYIASTSRYLVFEQNVAATRNKFLSIVNPYLESVVQRSGLYAFKVVMDETNNTPDLIDRNILYGQLYLQPTRTVEFIILDFNLMPTGAAFPTA